MSERSRLCYMRCGRRIKLWYEKGGWGGCHVVTIVILGRCLWEQGRNNFGYDWIRTWFTHTTIRYTLYFLIAITYRARFL